MLSMHEIHREFEKLPLWKHLFVAYFPQLAGIVLALAFAFVFCGCKNATVRDAKVYTAELDFMDAVAEEQSERGKALIEKECKCSEVVGIYGFETKECHELAETTLVIEARMKYHADFMRYLGGLSKERPPREPPEVPETNTLCPK